MLPSRRIAALLVLLCLAGLSGASPLRADWKILYYDQNGRLSDVEGGSTDAPVTPSGPPPSADLPAGASDSLAPSDSEAPAGGAPAGTLAAVPPSERFEPGEIIISDPPEGFELRAGQLGFSIIDKATLRSLAIEVYRLRVPRGSTVPAAVTRLRRQFPGLTVDANHLFDPSAGGPTPELYARSVMGWGLTSAECGRGVRLGAIDGAVDTTHPALAGRKLDYRSFSNPERRPGAIEHGTAIAAMLIGKAPWGGLLPAAELKHANIFEIGPDGRVVANAFGLVRGLEWVASQKVQVINLSVAGSSNQVLDQVLIRARRKGFILVAAAGNGGPQAPPAYPAAYHYVIAVTAVDINRQLYEFANRGSYVEFAAPGVGIWTAVPGGGRLQSGTSFAAPYVSVLIALDVARGRAKDPTKAREDLKPRMLDLGAPGRDDLYGWGLVRNPRNCSPQNAG